MYSGLSLVVALSTGMRKDEILGLRWADVDFVKGFVRVTDAESKSGRERNILMNALVFETLRSMDRTAEYVFQNPDTGKHLRQIDGSFRTALDRAGIKGFRIHDVRHTAASRMIEAGVDIVTVSRILGHATIQMTMRYAHPTPEAMRLAVEKLGEFLEKGREKVKTIETGPLPPISKNDN